MKVCMFFLLLILVVGIRCQKSTSTDIKFNDTTYLDLNSLETEQYPYFMKIEDTLRHPLNITDQNEIDEMMQSLINEGDVDAPFILEKDNGLLKR
ncbi:MAG: hypothetical protein KF763_12720 [Cyclobacteriaceae bacterium]|nr:hypothetical protein [Cyclobacteriaceae bacterium]